MDPNILTWEELVESIFYKAAESMDLKRGMFPRMENILYQWYVLQSESLTNAQFIEMARRIVEITAEQSRGNRHTNFTGSIQWLNGFRKRYAIEHGRSSGSSPTQQSKKTNKDAAEQQDIKNKTIVHANEASNNVFSPTIHQVVINEDVTVFALAPMQIDLENENIAEPPIVVIDDADAESSISSSQSLKRPIRSRRQTKIAPTKPTWAVRIFSQALKWAKENSSEKSEVQVLRKLYSRCVMSVNSSMTSQGTGKRIKKEVEVEI